MSLPLRSLATALVAGLALAVHATEPKGAADQAAETSSLTPQILYQFLLAEIAGGRGQLGFAAGAYVDLARSTRDFRIARRATEIAFHARQLEPALEAARIWNEGEPESEAARQALWTLLAATNHTDELAGLLIQNLARAGSNIGPQLLQLHRILANQQDRQAVLRVVDHVTLPYLTLPEAHFARAQAAQRAKESLRALAEIDQALQLKSDWEPAILFKVQLLLETPDRAVEALQGFISRNPQSGEAKLALARVLVDAKRYDESRQAFTALLEGQKDNPELIYAVGLLSMQLGDITLAESQLRRLLELGQGDQDGAHFYLGQIAEEGRRWSEAVDLYDQVTPISSRFAQARGRAAGLLARQGRIEEARAQLRQGAENSPKDRIVLVVAESKLLAEAQRFQDAINVLDVALAASPEDPTLLYESAMMSDRLSQYAVLEARLRKLIKLQPEHAHAHNALGYSLADRNLRLDEAQKLIEKALSLAPEDPFILDSMGWLMFRRGKAAQAEEYLRRAMTLSPDPEIAAHLGEVLWVLNRREEARKTWDEAIHAHPDNKALAATLKRFSR
ncbi:tetratricopeptide repeat protein [Denitratisoma oestradiolicum]|uniref:Tetratricopeptide repeat protein n=1 Tax=Denitratisoma oestradiolicum TaxID=311182 RepID=A0A6S6Y1P8_9PROT|nr:tetratricopeptide repeat protein [Denitratisoma oestradiolicum]CAB1370791.1 conserved exported protein of unknown function [Denitratisoma oestradiolicum]